MDEEKLRIFKPEVTLICILERLLRAVEAMGEQTQQEMRRLIGIVGWVRTDAGMT